MSSQPNVLSTLALCRRAGKLELGFDTVAQGVASKNPKKKVALVLTAEDLSPKSLKEMQFICSKHNMDISHLPAQMNELEKLLGKRVGIIGVTDEGLANMLKRSIERTAFK